MSERPVSLTAAGTVQGMEGCAVVGAALYIGFETVAGDPVSLSDSVALAVIGLGTGVLLLAIARGLLHRRGWSRTPAVLTQVFTGIVAVYLLQATQYGFGLPLLALAVAGVVTLFLPATLRALVR